jgi:hypothetical protein
VTTAGQRGRILGLAVLALALGGCVRGCPSSRPPIHPNPNMDYQPRYDPQAESDFFYNGSAMRLPVAGTVARGELIEDWEFETGKDAAGEFISTIPLPVDEALLARGEERYDIYCTPCHDKRGNGTGILAEYGAVPTATFHDEQRRGYAAGRVFDVATNGFGLMKGYRWPVGTHDRWAIVAYVQDMQQRRLESDLARAEGP